MQSRRRRPGLLVSGYAMSGASGFTRRPFIRIRRARARTHTATRPCFHERAATLDDAATPKRSLLPEHVFVLSQLLRRPIIIYGPRSFDGSSYEYPWNVLHNGIYLPLLHPPSLCYRTPLVLLYTKGHFSAGVFHRSFFSCAVSRCWRRARRCCSCSRHST